MNDPKCYVDKWFEIECRKASINNSESGIQIQKPYLKFLNVEVISIVAKDSTIEIMNPVSYSSMCSSSQSQSQSQNKSKAIDLRGSPFVYSQKWNKFMGIGCNNLALLRSNKTTVAGCIAICNHDEEIVNFDYRENGCNGRYCCETSLPMNLQEYNMTIGMLKQLNDSGTINSSSNEDDECGHALIVSSSWLSINHMSSYVYDVNGMGISKFSEIKNLDHVPAWFEWVILNNSKLQFHSDSDTDCSDTNVTSTTTMFEGRRCSCSGGSDAINPYIAGSCKAILENFNMSNRVKKWAIVGVSSSIGSITLLIGIWFTYRAIRKRMIKKRKEKFFKKNGGLLLKKRISSGEVNIDKTILFSLKDLKKATDNFNMNRILGKGGQGTVYKGMLVDGRIVAVKRFKVEGKVEEFINEFVILSQINNRNIVKLLGCCLETEIPLLVYEFIPNGNLFEHLRGQNGDNDDEEYLPMTLDMRLRIATEIAGALYYLHSIACQPIYHRDIKSTNILLDEKYKAKLADFGTSRIISIEATHITTVVQGTFGYLDPEYFRSCQFTEKSDVYSFGVVLVELLTSQKPISSTGPGEYQNLASYFLHCMEENILFDIVDKRVVNNEEEKEHIVAVANLAHRCLELNGRKRPCMKEVTLELERIWGLHRKSNVQPNPQEIDHTEIEEYQPWAKYSTSNSLSIPCGGTDTFSSDSEDMHILETK